MEYLAVFSPLAAFLVAGLAGRVIGARGAQIVTCAGVVIAALASVALFYQVCVGGASRTLPLATWFSSGDFAVEWALRIDTLSVVMMCVITIVSACVHVYSVGYMSHDSHRARFMAYLSLFTFAMLMLVSADNLIQLFFGWEGVGLASYLLIGFWNEKHSANAAAVKAFVVNRVGDFGLALGIMATFAVFGTVRFDDIFALAPGKAAETFVFMGWSVPALTLIALLLFIGACGKSAQLGLHTWLPDAMEGPTPVSALIHAATMVTAGVFLVARFSPVFEYAPAARDVVALVGGLTAFVAATIGLTQFDIKRVIAYSTMSQLGYMFFALGVSAYPAAMFHLTTHAFFKALLFLGAGSVIHALSGEQDMRKMGGIWAKIPVTYGLMWIGSLALAGVGVPFVFGLSGYYSKDIILEAAFGQGRWPGLVAFWLGMAAAIMTAFYSWRLIFMTFHGAPRADEKTMAHVHESPAIMVAPLVVLAAGAIFAGALLYAPFVGGGGAEHEVAKVENVDVDEQTDVEATVVEEEGLRPLEDRHDFWRDSLLILSANDTLDRAHHVPLWVKLAPVFAAVGGILLAFAFYIVRTDLPGRVAAAMPGLHRLLFRKWYFDEVYQALFVQTAQGLGRLFSSTGDRTVIDGLGPDGVALGSRALGRLLGRFQSGYMFQYALVMILAVVGFMTWYFYSSVTGDAP
jgi:NADH-quinone oxidoreductase subunit L